MKLILRLCAIVALSSFAALPTTAQDKPLLLRKPALSKDRIVFGFAGDLWSVPRAGGDAVRLTTGVGIESAPRFSPDGSMIAFTGEYDGNIDVYVIPAAGGVPKRLTYHPGTDSALGWTPDGTRVLFASGRKSHAGFAQLYTVGLNGGQPDQVPLPIAFEGSYAPEGKRIAYVTLPGQGAWKRYRGGMTRPVYIADLADSRIQKVPRQNSDDFNPMWIGDQVYFLSDRNGPVTLFKYDVKNGKVTEAVKNTGLDFKAASAGPGAIVYEQFGAIHLYDLASAKSTPVPIRIAADLLEVRPHFVKAQQFMHNGRISATGARALFEARGEIITVPVEKGDARNITNTPGLAERDPAWSPDGKSIAYFSDESGDYALHVRDQSGMGEVKKIKLSTPSSYYYTPVWSPDGKKIAFADKALTAWYVNIDGGAPVKIDSDYFETFQPPIYPVWSPDGKWIAYSKLLKNHLGAIMLYSLDSAKATQVTDGMSDARFPAFDKSGKYLFFTASTNLGLNIGNGDMTSIERPMSRSVYLAVLSKDDPSPLLPESDEEKAADAKKADDKPNTKVDLENIGQRIVALPIPTRNYSDLQPGKAGIIFLQESPAVALDPEGPIPQTLHRFDVNSRKLDKVIDGVLGLDVARNGEKMLVQIGENYQIVSTSGTVAPGAGMLKLADVEVWIDPKAEWAQMYHEVWRIERDFFYDPGFHGLDLGKTEAYYKPWLDAVASRDDLTYLFREMLGEMSVGHMRAAGGDVPQAPKVRGGLLGADYKIENERYRFSRIFNGESWNPRTRAPLTAPGVNVREGEYLLAVNGRDVPASEDVYRFFEGTAGKQTVVKVGPNADGSGAREVTVVPTASEQELRNLAWIEDNRRTVDRLSDGKLAYVYLPNTAGAGYVSFNRYFFAQTDRQGAVIDERFNGGGYLADYFIELLRRVPFNLAASRSGADELHPVGAIYGPKVMLINEMAGSGGDWLPWTFRRMGIGQLIGKRTWGGLVGIGGYPDLIDGGVVTAPRWAIYGLKGDWEVENVGVAPDIEVDFDPYEWRRGHDPQLERAVEVAMAELKKNPPASFKRPAYPNYHKK